MDEVRAARANAASASWSAARANERALALGPIDIMMVLTMRRSVGRLSTRLEEMEQERRQQRRKGDTPCTPRPPRRPAHGPVR